MFKGFFLNPLTNDKILEKTKFKGIADDKLNLTKLTISLFDRTENTVRKGEKCCLPSFPPFPTVLSKAFLDP